MTGKVEHDGTLEWYDYYDKDQIDFLNWQKVPTVQPNEPGTSCTSIHYYGLVTTHPEIDFETEFSD